MIQRFMDNFKKKSLQERFLLVLGIFFFLIYLTLGILIIFYDELPLYMPQSYRIVFGVILILYSFMRFMRFFNNNKS
jgi:cytochrome c biogenesis protein CcdA